MPLPLLWIVPAVAAGVIGIGAVLEEIEKNELEELRYQKEKIIKNSLNKIGGFSDNCVKMVKGLLESEIQIINGSMNDFIVELEKLNNTEFEESICLKELKALAIKKCELIETEESQLESFVKVASNVGDTFIDRVTPGVCKLKSYKACLKYIEIRKRAVTFHRYLLLTNTIFEQLIYKMKQIIADKGTDFNTFSADEKNVIAEAMVLAGVIKSILNMPLLIEEVGLLPEPE